MRSQSEEGGAEGLGWIDADVVRFGIDDTRRFKVPHMGWNGVRVARSSPLLEGVTEQTEFYFVHAYHMVCRDGEDVLCDTDYGYPIHLGGAAGERLRRPVPSREEP